MTEPQQTNPQQVTFSYQELAELLIKHRGIHEGLWGIYAEFTLGATLAIGPPPSETIVPAALVPIQSLGIQRYEEEVDGLTVDAAIVNPASGAGSQTGKGDTS